MHSIIILEESKVFWILIFITDLNVFYIVSNVEPSFDLLHLIVFNLTCMSIHFEEMFMLLTGLCMFN